MLLARRGLRVLAVDRDRYGTDTLSTHALMRGGVLQLHRWGILEELRAAGTPTVRSTSFHYADDVVDVQIKPQDGIDGLTRLGVPSSTGCSWTPLANPAPRSRIEPG